VEAERDVPCRATSSANAGDDVARHQGHRAGFAAILWSEGSSGADNRLPGRDERDFSSSFATLAQQQQAASL
jgi:hypothetical protein